MSLLRETAAAQPLSPRLGGPTFTLRHRLLRIGWRLSWLALARFTPSPLHGWRRALLKLWGARLAASARVYPDVVIWWPAHLVMETHASLGPGVTCYNVGEIRLGAFAIVSQRAHLCSGTHDCHDPDFPLRSLPIEIGANAWIAAEAFVGPGVTVAEGAVLGARGVAMRNLSAWTVHAGNPASPLRERRRQLSNPQA